MDIPINKREIVVKMIVNKSFTLLLFKEVKAKCKHSLKGSFALVKVKVSLSSSPSIFKSFLIIIPSCNSKILSYEFKEEKLCLNGDVMKK